MSEIAKPQQSKQWKKPGRRRVETVKTANKVASRLKTPPSKKRACLSVAAGRSPSRKTLIIQFHNYRKFWRSASLAERVMIEREGVPANVVKGLIDGMGLSSVDFPVIVGMHKATFTRKMRERSHFSGMAGQSVVGFVELINKVEDMLAAQVDNPEAANFDAQKWVGKWVQQPQPALGGITPAELMDVPSGRALVMRVLGAMQSGAYQ